MKKQSGLKEKIASKKEKKSNPQLILFSKCVFSLLPEVYRQKFIWSIYQTILNKSPNHHVIFIYIIYRYKHFQISGFIELLLFEVYWIR